MNIISVKVQNITLRRRDFFGRSTKTWPKTDWNVHFFFLFRKNAYVGKTLSMH